MSIDSKFPSLIEALLLQQRAAAKKKLEEQERHRAEVEHRLWSKLQELKKAEESLAGKRKALENQPAKPTGIRSIDLD